MKFVFAPDSFKGSLSSLEVCAVLSRAASRHYPDARLDSIAMADGGEGTVEAIVSSTGGRLEEIRVTGPMGDPVTARYGVLEGGKVAVLEMAQASGLPLVFGEKNPLRAGSRGTGELISHVLSQGFDTLYIGIGGSATNDGGMGMLTALGARFFDEAGRVLEGSGEELSRVRSVEFSGLAPGLRAAKLVVISDVTNPLLGEKGATMVYGPQKGATPEMLLRLEAGMKNYASVIERALNKDISKVAGAGAAGGMGAALGGVLGAAVQSGISTVLDVVGFDARVKEADLVITGEGRIDAQSIRYGKVAAGVAKRCAQYGVPVVAIVGGMGEGAEELFDLAQSSIMTTINASMDVPYAMEHAKVLLDSAADRMFRLMKIGERLGGQ